jgi:hypothetical protein
LTNYLASTSNTTSLNYSTYLITYIGKV